MSITARTSEYALRERHRLSMSTDAAGLTRVGRIDFDQDSPSFCRFGVQMGKEGRPRGVRNAFGKTMVVHHPVDGQILNSNDAISIHDGTGVLVSEVLSTPGNTFMHPRYHLPMLLSLRRSPGKLGVLALHFCQGLLFLAKEAWVGNLFSGRQGGKGCESHIYPDLLCAFGKSERLALYGKAGIPLAGGGAVDGQGLDLATQGAMVDHFDGSDLGDHHSLIMGDSKARLRESEGVVAITTLEARIAFFFRMLSHPAEEGFEGQVNSHGHILQDLGMDAF